jgi:catechol 2,3-dioxygenase-like lactoylglutathione lyase family enzyme
VRLFHYHLVTSKVRQTEARYLGKLGFGLVARYGRIGEEQASFEAGIPWEELDRLGFRLRLTELQQGAVNVVLQPGHWEVPRVDHLGVMLDEDDFADVLARADAQGLRVQEHAGRRTFVATNAGFRLEVHPPRDWIDELLVREDELKLVELRLRADDPAAKAGALRGLLGIESGDGEVGIGGAVIRFVPGGPQGRPELDAERFA